MNKLMSLNAIAQSYVDSVGQPYDFGLKERVKFSIKYWRATLIRRSFERQPRDTKLLQFFFVPLEMVDITDNCDIVTGCNIKVARNIPRPISLKDTQPFSFLGDVKGSESFLHSSLTEIKTSACNRFNSFVTRYRFINGNAYIYGKKLSKNIRVEGYFEDPIQAANLCSSSLSCVSDDDVFLIDASMIETILRGLRSGELDIKSPNPEVEYTKE